MVCLKLISLHVQILTLVLNAVYMTSQKKKRKPKKPVALCLKNRHLLHIDSASLGDNNFLYRQAVTRAKRSCLNKLPMNKSHFSVQVRKWKIKEAVTAASWQCFEPVRHEEGNGAKCRLIGCVPSWTSEAHVLWTWFCPTLNTFMISLILI